MRIWLTVMALAISAQATATELEVRILTPPEHASVFSESVYLVGWSTFEYVDIAVNGFFVAQTKVSDSVFHNAIELGYGINEIVVSASYVIDGDTMTIADTTEALYSPTSNPRYQKIYDGYEFHGSQTESRCARCHQNVFDEDASVEDTAGAVGCLGCHQNMAASFKRHIKTEKDECVICHARGEGLRRARSVDNNLCFTCHPERQGMFTKEYVHGPVAGGSCICHNPHGSPYEKSLVNPVQILCVSCHTQLEAEAKKAVLHHPFESGNCVACHDPHSTSNRWVLVKNSQEVCMTCHDPEQTTFEHDHPYNVRPRNKLNTPLKLTARGQLECISCHTPHASATKHLLRTTGNFTCAGCHEEKL